MKFVEKNLLLIVAAVVALFLIMRKPSPSPSASSGSSAFGLNTVISGLGAFFGGFTSSSSKGSTPLVEIPTNGNTLPGAPTFGPTLEDGSLYT